MNQISMGQNSVHTIMLFNTFEELAQKTLPYLNAKTVAVSGGTTYLNLFEHWRKLMPHDSTTSFFPVDERIVPFYHWQSNWGNTYNHFLQHIGRQEDKSHFFLSADTYETLLNSQFQTSIPIFDVIFLGVGTDGHTASLFPDSEAISDKIHIVGTTKSPSPPHERITLMPIVMASASHVITIISGEGKNNVVQKLLQTDMTLPIVKILSLRKSSDIYIHNQYEALKCLEKL